MKRTWILEQLNLHLSPTFLEVIDESARHVGHQGVSLGETETHFRIRIQSPLLAGLPRVAQHQRIYEILPLEQLHIHALTLEIIS